MPPRARDRSKGDLAQSRPLAGKHGILASILEPHLCGHIWPTSGMMSKRKAVNWHKQSLAYYRYTSNRPPRELLLQTLLHLEWEKKSRRGLSVIDLGFGAGTDTLELLKRGWRVLAIDRQQTAAEFLSNRVPPRYRASLTMLVAPMEEVDLPQADLVYASYSLPFCPPDRFSEVWTKVRKAIRPGGHFAGQLFGNRDSWRRNRAMSFHTRAQVRGLTRGLKLEMLRETDEEGMAFSGLKRWHFYDIILEKPLRSV